MIASYAMTSFTLAEGLFLCAFVVGGPLFGFLALYRSQESFVSVPFLFGTFSAYAGWFVSGIIALVLHPNVLYYDSSESISVLYLVPGLLSGYLGLLFIDRIAGHRTPRLKIATATQIA